MLEVNKIVKCIWVAEALQRAGERGLSLKEINAKWVKNDQLSDGVEIARQTFDRWKKDIEKLLDISIECNRKGGYRYRIENLEALEEHRLSRWLLETYSTMNALTRNVALKDRILVEEIPSSHEYLTDILEAMKENRVLELTYKSFKYEDPTTFQARPYCVKMFQRRWYMVAFSVYDKKMRIYSLDRIKGLKLLEEHFEMPEEFDAKEYFSGYFGVVRQEAVKPERILLRASTPHQHYLRTLPLHESQKEVYACDEYADFELYLRPTYDLVMEILRAGGMLEVIEPQALRAQMHGLAGDLWEIYKND